MSYVVMKLLMAATPLAMQVCGLPFSDAAFVLEWHVIGMSRRVRYWTTPRAA